MVGPAQEIADEFLENPAVRKISFTGSTEVGKQLMRAAADQVKRLSLELGGHAPLIVFPDADVEQVAQAAVIGKFRNNGQVCIAPSRFYVHEKISKAFTEAAPTRTSTSPGPAMGSGTSITFGAPSNESSANAFITPPFGSIPEQTSSGRG